MFVQLPEMVIHILDTFQENNYEIYIVGGAVRDILMDKQVYDWDFTTNATPPEMLKIFPDAFYDNIFGTIGIPNKIEGERPYEITTFRTEHSYSDSRRPDKVEWGQTLEEDLKRRDFTWNAMALRAGGSSTNQEVLRTGGPSRRLSKTSGSQPGVTHKLHTTKVELIDLYNGQKDLKDKLVRAVGDPNERFSEDALRMMRAIRIASELGFTIEENTCQAIKINAAQIVNISKERVRDELFKILKSPHPYAGMLLFKNVGLMGVLLPEMEKTFGVEQKSPGRHHVYDVGTHSLLSLKFCPSEDPIVRFATLIHDIGKAQTYKKLASGVITFYNHEIVSARIASRIADRLRFSKTDKEKLYKLIIAAFGRHISRQISSIYRR